MSIEKLQRVMWRVRQNTPGSDRVKILDLRRAIMHEVGTDIRTYYVTKGALTLLGWIRAINNKWVKLTGKDLTDT